MLAHFSFFSSSIHPAISENLQRRLQSVYKQAMFFRLSLLTTTLILTLSCAASVQDAPKCEPPALRDLPLQLGSLAQPRPIDDCSCQGASRSPAGRPPNPFALQNLLKNNFLAPAGNPKPITTRDLVRLQQVVDRISLRKLPRGERDQLPTVSQRRLLQNLILGDGRIFSEGEVVRLIGFVIDARHSNVHFNREGVLSGGESVNCNRLGCANNDIHIDLSGKPRKDGETEEARMLDDGAVAEISPRHRPASWELFDSPDYRPFFRTHPVMFTGQLFYDASHKPRAEPPRASVWEVHPVYAISVCLKTSLPECRPELANDPAVWVPFDRLSKHLGLVKVRRTTTCNKAP